MFAVVTNDLEAADHLTNGEETKALGSHNTASDQLGRVDVPELLHHGRGLLRSLGGGLRESTGVADGVQHVLVIALECLHGTMIKVSHVATSRQPQTQTYGGDIFWLRKTSLASSEPTRPQ